MKSEFDRVGYKDKPRSTQARYIKIVTPQPKLTKAERTENARLRKIRQLCAHVRNQEHLNGLLAQAQPEDRRQIFECYLPYLRFDAVFPE